MAGGWSRDGAVQDQINASVEDAVREARRRAVLGVRRCVACQEAADAEEQRATGGINRRGSKDSQLR